MFRVPFDVLLMRTREIRFEEISTTRLEEIVKIDAYANFDFGGECTVDEALRVLVLGRIGESVALRSGKIFFE